MEATGFIFFLMVLFSLAVTVIASFAMIDEHDTGVEGFKPLGTFILSMIVGIIAMFIFSSSAWWLFVFGPGVAVVAVNLILGLFRNKI